MIVEYAGQLLRLLQRIDLYQAIGDAVALAVFLDGGNAVIGVGALRRIIDRQLLLVYRLRLCSLGEVRPAVSTATKPKRFANA